MLSAPFVSRLVRSDDELAFLLAHEMAHVLLEHGRRGYEAAVPLTGLAGPVDARLIHENLQSSLALHLRLSPLMRAQESEADRLAAQLAAAAGFGDASPAGGDVKSALPSAGTRASISRTSAIPRRPSRRR